MISIVTLPVPEDRCANLACTNRFGHGLWSLVDVGGDPSADSEWERRGLRLSMCTPCAGMLAHAVGRKGVGK